jgi:hypothetical protein
VTKATTDDKIATIQKRFHAAEKWESAARTLFKEDKRFANADSDHVEWQWPTAVYKARNPVGDAPRPCLVVNKCAQHNLMIINDGRENKPSVKVHATGFGATAEAAQTFESLIRHIEYQSKASAVYTSATVDQVEAGWGYWRIVTEYPPDDSFEQEIYIRRVQDPLSVYLDPDAQELDKSDARWGFVFRDMPRSEFEAEYPQYKDMAGATSMESGNSTADWCSKDTVRVAEYYERTEMTDTLWAVPADMIHPGHPGGTIRESAMIEGLPDAVKAAKLQSRDVPNITVSWSLVVGNEVVDQMDTAYNSIPIVLVVGRETVIDGKLDRKGHTRAMKDAQRMYNYNASAAVEYGALQTKVPWVVQLESIEGLEIYWETANIKNHAYLPYNSKDLDSGVPVQPPVRPQPPSSAPVFMEGMQVADQQMQMASGQYDAQMGAEGNERTGIAIQERQRQGDKATYHFIDNLGIAIAYTGRILVDLIPKVYDTKRVIQILGEDGTRTQVQVDPAAPAAHTAAPTQGPPQPSAPPQPSGQPDAMVIFNPTIGRYAVEAEVGPSYNTQREEAANAYQQVMSMAGIGPLVADLYFKSSDFPTADEAAERLHNMLPSQATGGPSPEVQRLQQHLQAAGAQVQQLTGALKQAGDDLASAKLQSKDKSANTSIDQYRAETDRMEALHDINPELMRPLVTQLVLEALHAANGGEPGMVTSVLPHPNAAPPPPPIDPNQAQPGATP